MPMKWYKGNKVTNIMAITERQADNENRNND